MPLRDLATSYSGIVNPSISAIESDVIQYGPLRVLTRKEIPKPPAEREEIAPGIRGLLGMRQKMIIEQKPEVKYNVNEVPIGSVLEDTSKVNPSDKAFSALFRIRADVRDSAGRGGAVPLLTVVSDHPTLAMILDFVCANPGSYYRLLREIVPRDRFPKVNAGILDKAIPGKRIIIVNSSNVKEGYEKGEWELEKSEEFYEGIAMRDEKNCAIIDV